MTDGQPTEKTLRFVVRAPRFCGEAALDFKRTCGEQWVEGTEFVVIDFDAVEFLDSSGIGALLSVCKRLPAGTMRVTLLRVRPPVQSVIELMRLHRILKIQN